jgi:hypothetical protein
MEGGSNTVFNFNSPDLDLTLPSGQELQGHGLQQLVAETNEKCRSLNRWVADCPDGFHYVDPYVLQGHA